MTDALSSMFHSPFYIRHNQRRLEHLASLHLDLVGKNVLEPGAGVGDHTLFYLDRGCRVTSIEPRPENVTAFRRNVAESGCRHGGSYRLIEGDFWAVESLQERFDVVHAYGVLYHLSDPARAIAAMARVCEGLLLLETCVSPDSSGDVNPIDEPAANVSQAVDGRGCRPERGWLVGQLKSHFPFVYAPREMPFHEQFTDGSSNRGIAADPLTRAIYVASRQSVASPFLQTARN